jgi:hypothetical protein
MVNKWDKPGKCGKKSILDFPEKAKAGRTLYRTKYTLS